MAETHEEHIAEARRQRGAQPPRDIAEQGFPFDDLQPDLVVRKSCVQQATSAWFGKMQHTCNADQLKLIQIVRDQVMAEHRDLINASGRKAVPVRVLVTGQKPPDYHASMQ